MERGAESLDGLKSDNDMIFNGIEGCESLKIDVAREEVNRKIGTK